MRRYLHEKIGLKRDRHYLQPGYQNFFMALDRLPKVTDVPQVMENELSLLNQFSLKNNRDYGRV